MTVGILATAKWSLSLDFWHLKNSGCSWRLSGGLLCIALVLTTFTWRTSRRVTGIINMCLEAIGNHCLQDSQISFGSDLDAATAPWCQWTPIGKSMPSGH